MSIAKTALKGVTHYDPSKAFEGYTLFAPFMTTDVWLINMEGYIVHRWQMPNRCGGHGVLLSNGHLLITQRAHDPEEWGLPEYLILAIAGHHDFSEQSTAEPAVRLVSLIRYSDENDGNERLIKTAENAFGIGSDKMQEMITGSFDEAEQFADSFQ